MNLKSSLCRFCSAPLSDIFVDLGETPLANSYVEKNKLHEKESFYPLKAFVCSKCFLVQLEEFVSAENIFSDYSYFSSFSDTMLKHCEDYVEMMVSKFQFNSNSLVVEIASNDGYLLQYFKKKNIPILGIEPAANVAKVAEEKGIPTTVEFFNTEYAQKMKDSGKQADLIIGNNVLAHVPKLNDFVAGMKILLKPKGIITIEFPHLLQLIKHNQFDTIYHEHFSYFSFFVVQKIFSVHGMKLFDVDEISTHGGSLRIYATHKENDDLIIHERVENLLKKEKNSGLLGLETYLKYSTNVDSVKQNLIQFLKSEKNNNKTIICYGATAKGNTLLNYCQIGTNYIDYMVDRSPYKQERYLPGTHIPIKSPDVIRQTKPDFILILAWNLKDEIMKQLEFVKEWGAQFVIPIPQMKIYS